MSAQLSLFSSDLMFCLQVDANKEIHHMREEQRRIGEDKITDLFRILEFLSLLLSLSLEPQQTAFSLFHSNLSLSKLFFYFFL